MWVLCVSKLHSLDKKNKSEKEIIAVGMVKKWIWPLWSRDSKIGCLKKELNGIKPISRMLRQIQEN